MMLAKKNSWIFTAFLLAVCMFGNQLRADQFKPFYNKLAQKLLENLPMDKKIVLKSLTPEESGLPRDFLINLISDVEKSLLDVSDFEINLQNRLSMESEWREAIEFNNADFSEILTASQSDILLMVNPRALDDGLEVSIIAYATSSKNVGKVLASTGTHLLQLDLENMLGVNNTSLNDQMKQVLNEVKKIGAAGGIISEPKTYAEYYHNARVFMQRGETDLAMRNFEQAIDSDFIFVDPIEDLLSLAIARYGQAGAKLYFEKKIRLHLPRELQLYGDLYVGSDLLDAAELIISKRTIFSPYKALFQRRHEGPYGVDKVFVKAWKNANKHIAQDYRNGIFQSYYINSLRSVEIGQGAVDNSSYYENLFE
jgi:hypothetical protein